MIFKGCTGTGTGTLELCSITLHLKPKGIFDADDADNFVHG